MKFSFMLVTRIIETLWAILIACWVVFAFGNKRTKIRQDRRSTLAYMVVLGAIAYEILSQRSLNFPLLPINTVTRAMGVFLCASGISFAIWARRALGRNWSGFVVIKQDHELIQRGPYKVVRHPIYTGLILALTGTVLALIPTVKAFVLDLIWVLAFYVKARHEEHVLLREFGERYAEYKRRVKAALIPFVL